MSFANEEENDGSEPVNLGDVQCVGESDKALKVTVGTGFKSKSYWVPKSVIHDDSDVYKKGHAGKLVVVSWYANKEGLV